MHINEKNLEKHTKATFKSLLGVGWDTLKENVCQRKTIHHDMVSQTHRQ